MSVTNTNTIGDSKPLCRFGNLYNLSNTYEDIKDEIPSLVEVYQILKERGMLGERKKWVKILHGISNLEEYRDRLE